MVLTRKRLRGKKRQHLASKREGKKRPYGCDRKMKKTKYNVKGFPSPAHKGGKKRGSETGVQDNWSKRREGGRVRLGKKDCSSRRRIPGTRGLASTLNQKRGLIIPSDSRLSEKGERTTAQKKRGGEGAFALGPLKIRG